MSDFSPFPPRPGQQDPPLPKPGPSIFPSPQAGQQFPKPGGLPVPPLNQHVIPGAPILPVPPGWMPLPPGAQGNMPLPPGVLPNPQVTNPYPPRMEGNQGFLPMSSPQGPVINPMIPLVPSFPTGTAQLPGLMPPNRGGLGMQPPGYAPAHQPAMQERTIQVKPSILQIIQQYNMHVTIIDLYPNAYFDFQGKNLKITARPEHIEEIVGKMQNLQVRLDFDPNARWACLQNDGQYMLYEAQISNTIECAYQQMFPELLLPGYLNYSWSVQVTASGSQYEIQFAQMGGVHRQIKRQGANTIIRAVRRQANGEDLNKDFVRNYKWLWKHEDGKFRPYEDDAIFLIEQSYIEWKDAGGHTNKNKRIALIQGCNGNTYKIEYATMKQFNEITDFARLIKREPPDQ